MGWLAASARELFSLFVDDVPFSLAIGAWLGAGAWFLPESGLNAAWDAPLLFAGLAVILVASVRLTAARHHRRGDRA